ncbi:hypothetical protein ACXR6G_07745 [Ancylomarina sp. YFZ004]
MNGMIAPLLFLPLVENAFKHTARNDGVASTISISLNLEKDFCFTIKNPINNSDEPKGNGGIGLENLQKRLDLIYPGKYSLIIKKEEGYFKVELRLMILNRELCEK